MAFSRRYIMVRIQMGMLTKCLEKLKGNFWGSRAARRIRYGSPLARNL